MAQYPQQNFDAMRQDAIRRSREMQRRAMPHLPPEPLPKSAPAAAPRERKETPQQRQDLLSQLHLSQNLQKFLTDWDSEKLALLALLYLLYKEGAEPELLLAIAYILL